MTSLSQTNNILPSSIKVFIDKINADSKVATELSGFVYKFPTEGNLYREFLLSHPQEWGDIISPHLADLQDFFNGCNRMFFNSSNAPFMKSFQWIRYVNSAKKILKIPGRVFVWSAFNINIEEFDEETVEIIMSYKRIYEMELFGLIYVLCSSRKNDVYISNEIGRNTMADWKKWLVSDDNEHNHPLIKELKKMFFTVVK